MTINISLLSNNFNKRGVNSASFLIFYSSSSCNIIKHYFYINVQNTLFNELYFSQSIFRMIHGNQETKSFENMTNVIITFSAVLYGCEI
jgi:hypothetical protein